MADEAKAKGNQAFSGGLFEEAIQHFSDAIALAPDNHVLYSNRSASYASLNKYREALEDAKKTVELQPAWAKGYSRLGAAYSGLRDYDEAIVSYQKGLEVDPQNEALKSGLADAEAALERTGGASGGMGAISQAFQGPEVFAKLHADPRTRPFMSQPDFVSKLQAVQRNPQQLNQYLTDARMIQALGVLIGVSISTADSRSPFGAEDSEEGGSGREPMQTEPGAQQSRRAEPAPAPEPEVSPEEKEKKERKEAAAKEKEAGNAAYKKKEFDTAIERYSKAIELDDEDVTYLTNRAAVYLEMGKYDECIADCDKAAERGRELHADYKLIARALTRKGTAYVKMAQSSQDYDSAIAAFNKALTEHRNPDTLKKLNDAERAKKEKEQQEYYDPAIADQEREKGNEFFKTHKYPDAVKCYTEAIRRNPQDVKAYSNRAASYTKLAALHEGLKDAEKCIELDPAFVKGYLRKGAVQFFMKEYDKAIKTYQLGLKLDPSNQELLDGIKSCVGQISRANRGDISADDLKERQARAMADPEVQNILTDPIMRQVLQDFQENPKAAAEHQKNPMVMAKIQKLVSAGIVQIR